METAVSVTNRQQRRRLAEVGTRYFFFDPLAAIPLFKNLSPLSAIPQVFQKFPVRYR